MRAIHNLSRAVYAILALGLGALNAYAFDFENPIKANDFDFENPIKANDFGTVVQAIAGLMLKIGIPVATIFLLYAGFLFVTARGDETKLKTAKEVFWYTVIGTAIIVGASVIASAVVNFAKNLS